MTEKCPELKGSEKLNPGSQIAKMVCAFKNTPTPPDIAKGLVKNNEGLVGQAANNLDMKNRRNKIDAAVESAGG